MRLIPAAVVASVLLLSACAESPDPSAAEYPAIAEHAEQIQTNEMPDPDAPTTHCVRTELVAFSCEIANSNKVLSLCQSDPYTADTGYLQYRFGAIGHIDLTFPSDLQVGASPFKWQMVGYAGGWDTRIAFTNGATTYQVYDRNLKAGMTERDVTGGVLVFEGGERIADVQCDVASLSGDYSLNRLSEILPGGDFFEEGD